LLQSQPPWLARPLYGLAAPAIILVTLVTNSLVIVVLSNRNLRTPTNHILLSMAIAELMTGLSSCPWFLYYYTFGGLYEDQQHGLSDFWCRTHPYFAVYLPTIFHTTAIWLTVYLAIQRYIYVSAFISSSIKVFQQISGCLTSNRLMHATTRMLLVVIAIFLLIEIPVALIFIMHLLVVFYRLLDMSDYKTINNLLIVRFGLFCSTEYLRLLTKDQAIMRYKAVYSQLVLDIADFELLVLISLRIRVTKHFSFLPKKNDQSMRRTSTVSATTKIYGGETLRSCVLCEIIGPH
uniref:G_PROTEIN_RECEP_F1_2 domain-containing protein n=1 Tax=Angiostrongylus cantonensis TaxID=6313 RepID=A0A0K0D1U2_ANGCA